MNEAEDKFAQVRRQMLEHDLKGRDITDPGVLKVMAEIRRQEFIPPSYRFQAYTDGPLPIGCGQTISQPYIVALMTQALRVNQHCEVLEIGTGSGYQTAVLCKLAKKVYTVEKCNELSESAQAVLGGLGIKNVEFFIGDGSCGWCEKRTFDRIIVTAALPQIPQALADQLIDEGLMVAPVGSGTVQELMLGEKKNGKLSQRNICDVRFVKILGKYGFEE
jgi:protein-L-isoaspartate(D-aspartate) O-methyltransferase